jgi:hypothetical protein
MNPWVNKVTAQRSAGHNIIDFQMKEQQVGVSLPDFVLNHHGYQVVECIQKKEKAAPRLRRVLLPIATNREQSVGRYPTLSRPHLVRCAIFHHSDP